MKMFFVVAKQGLELRGRNWPLQSYLMRMRIGEEEMPLVAFQNRDLGEQFLAHTLGSDELQLTGEDALDPETLEELIGEPLFLFQDQCMMDEIRRRGTGFPFCEFVSEYGRELWVTS